MPQYIDFPSGGQLVFVPRAEWDPQVDFPWQRVQRPSDELYIHHTTMRASADPCQDARNTERVLDQRGLDGYNYLIHPSGVVLEFAGERRGEHTYGTNSDSYGYAFIGNFQYAQVTLQAIVAASRLVNLQRLKGDLVAHLPALQIRGHREVKATLCPGDNNMNINGRTLMDWIRWFAQMEANA